MEKLDVRVYVWIQIFVKPFRKFGAKKEENGNLVLARKEQIRSIQEIFHLY